MVNNRWLAKQVWWVVPGWNWSCAGDMLYKEDTQVKSAQRRSTSPKTVRPWVNPLHTHSPNTHNSYKHKTAYADGFLSEWQVFTYILTKVQNVKMLTVLKFLPQLGEGSCSALPVSSEAVCQVFCHSNGNLTSTRTPLKLRILYFSLRGNQPCLYFLSFFLF